MRSANRYNRTEAARLCGVTMRTLRHYEKIGLVKPIFEKDNKVYYQENHLAHIWAIKLIKKSGLKLKDIKNSFDYEKRKKIASSLQKQIDENSKKIEELLLANTQTKRLLIYFDWMDKYVNSFKDYELGKIKVENRKEKEIIFIQKKNIDFNQINIFAFFNELLEKAVQNDLIGSGIVGSIIRSNPENPEKIDFEVYTDVNNLKPELSGSPFIKKLSKMKVASLIFKGSYIHFAEQINKLKQWITDNNYVEIGEIYREYLLPLAYVNDPEDMITDIYIPVRKKN